MVVMAPLLVSQVLLSLEQEVGVVALPIRQRQALAVLVVALTD